MPAPPQELIIIDVVYYNAKGCILPNTREGRLQTHYKNHKGTWDIIPSPSQEQARIEQGPNKEQARKRQGMVNQHADVRP